MLVSQLHFQNLELPIQDEEYAVGKEGYRIWVRVGNAECEDEKSSLKGQWSKQHEEQKGKREEGPVLVYSFQLFPMLASFSQKEKR